MAVDLCAELKDFADSLAPSEALVDKVGRTIQRLSEKLTQHFKQRRSIARIVPLGSYGKKTSLRIKMDLDLVIFLNNKDYPFKEYLDDLHDFITLQDSYTNCEITTNGVSFLVEEMLHVDLKVATNRYTLNETNRGIKAGDEQRRLTLDFIKKSRNPFNAAWQQSTALSETAVEFVKNKNMAFHCSTLARLAKFWNKTVHIGNFTSGRSTIIELIAIRTAEEIHQRGRENTLLAFRRFLDKISNVGQMAILWTDYYHRQDIDQRINDARPLLLDPTNQYNNILRGKNVIFMKEMAEYAKVTLNRIDAAECRALQGLPVDLPTIFMSQPEWLSLPISIRRERKLTNFYVDTADCDELTMPKTVTRIKECDREIVENLFFSFTEIVAVDARKKGSSDVGGRVREKVKNMVAPKAKWVPGTEPLRADVKLKVPFRDENENTKALRVCFDIRPK